MIGSVISMVSSGLSNPLYAREPSNNELVNTPSITEGCVIGVKNPRKLRTTFETRIPRTKIYAVWAEGPRPSLSHVPQPKLEERSNQLKYTCMPGNPDRATQQTSRIVFRDLINRRKVGAVRKKLHPLWGESPQRWELLIQKQREELPWKGSKR